MAELMAGLVTTVEHTDLLGGHRCWIGTPTAMQVGIGLRRPRAARRPVKRIQRWV